MTRLQTINGKLLFIDGKLITSDKCCCDDTSECPSCPPLASLPQFCQMKVTTPLGDYHYHYPGSVENIPQWHVLTEGDPEYDEVPAGECWYGITIPLEAGKCIGYCENISPNVPMDDIVCEHATSCCCDEALEDGNCPEGRIVAATGTWKLSGFIRYAKRELISDGYGQIQYKYDCKNKKIYRRLKFEYQHTQHLSGRFVGTKSLKIVTDPGTDCPGVICYENHWDYNLDGHHECDECPYFN